MDQLNDHAGILKSCLGWMGCHDDRLFLRREQPIHSARPPYPCLSVIFACLSGNNFWISQDFSAAREQGFPNSPMIGIKHRRSPLDFAQQKNASAICLTVYLCILFRNISHCCNPLYYAHRTSAICVTESQCICST